MTEGAGCIIIRTENIEEENMAKSEGQKIKLLKIYDILRTESDAEHPMSTNDLLERLREEGIRCERKSLASDIAFLNEYGYGIQVKRARQNLYSLTSRDLSIHAIRFLVDATQSAAFLSKTQTKEIVSSVAMLAGSNKAEVLKDNVLCFDKLKHSNDEVLGTITGLDRAIEHRKKVSFEYHLLDVDGKAKPKRDENGQIRRYCVTPVALAYHGGYYYLIADQKEGRRVFRIDRMRAVRVEKEEFAPNAAITQFKNGELKDTMGSFGMWIGGLQRVTMRLLNEHAGDIFDKFGEKTRLYPDGDGHFLVTVEVNPKDPVFLGWCMSYGKELEILSPTETQKDLLRLAEQICAMYSPSKM